MPRIPRFFTIAAMLAVVLSSCASPPAPAQPTAAPQPPVRNEQTKAEVTRVPRTGALAQQPIGSPAPATPTPPAGGAGHSARTPTPTPGRAATFAKTVPGQHQLMIGYYVPYDPTSWDTLKAEAGNLDIIGAQWVDIDPCGGISSRDDQTLIDFARAHGIRVFPSMLTGDSDLNHYLLADKATRDHAVQQIVAYVTEMGYDGFDSDMEDIKAADRDNYSEFIRELSAALHAKGKLLMAALPPKDHDVRTGWAGPYDYAALGSSLDYAMIMTYDYSWSTSPPGSIAPIDWVDKVMAYVTSQMPREKVLLGVAFYGYDWDTTTGARARGLRYDQAAAVAAKYGASITNDKATASATFSYTSKAGDPTPPAKQVDDLNHTITRRKAAACDRTVPPLPTPTETPTPPKGTPLKHVVWLENASSLDARLQLAEKYGVGGVGAWRLGQEDPAVWPIVEKWRSPSGQ